MKNKRWFNILNNLDSVEAISSESLSNILSLSSRTIRNELRFLQSLRRDGLIPATPKERVQYLLEVSYVPVALVLFAGSALRVPMFSLINGSGNSKLNLAVALLDRILVRIGLALFLGLFCGMGVYGFWYGHAISGFVPFFIGGIYYLSGKWKSRQAL